MGGFPAIPCLCAFWLVIGSACQRSCYARVFHIPFFLAVLGELFVVTDFVEWPLLPVSDAEHGGMFSYSTADSVKSAFELAATDLEGKAGTRGTFVSSAMQEVLFLGIFCKVSFSPFRWRPTK